MTRKFRKYLSLSLAVIMASTLTAGQALAFADELKEKEGVVTTYETNGISFSDVTGRTDVSSVAISNFNSQVIQNYVSEAQNKVQTVIVKLEQESLVELANNMSVSTYLSTSTGRKSLLKIEKAQNDFLTKLTLSGIDYTLVDSYSTIMSGVTIEVDTTRLSEIKAISNVESVVVSDYYAFPETAEAETTSTSFGAKASDDAVSNPNNVYATGIYDSSEYVNAGIDGRGMTVAVLDTGLDASHAAFQADPIGELGMDRDYIGTRLANGNLSAQKLSAARGQSFDIDDVYYSNKIPFAYDYSDSDTDVYPSYNSHGVHVAGIVAGKADRYTNKDGDIAKDERGEDIPFRGVAPEAQLMICKVFTDDFDSADLGGATTETLLAALDDCVLLGVDVINMSLGTVAGFSSIYIEGDSEGELLNRTYEKIRDAGISLVCAASNEYSAGYGSVFGTNLASNPDSGTVGSPSTFTGALSVASINGQTSPYLKAGGSDGEAIFFENSSDENSVQFDFVSQMLEGETNKTFKYVVVPNTGRASDYTSSIRHQLADKADDEKVIAVVSRGNNTFQDKVYIAKENGADAIIIYNNVAGMVRMSVGDLVEPIPAISVSLEAGRTLINTPAASRTIEIDTTFQAGPFMNDYSSWGVTSDLLLKPEITAHGGEITSAVPGGYDEMSGTSMATPNLAGFIALMRSKLIEDTPRLGLEANRQELNELIYQIIMSTAEMVEDQEGLPYSPRKQGSGLAMLKNVMETKAYLYTEGTDAAEGGRPKVELKQDFLDDGGTYWGKGEYDIDFTVKNTSTSSPLTFIAKSTLMTETLSMDGLSVAEKAYILDDVPAVWTISGNTYSDGDTITVPANSTLQISVKITLSNAEKDYIQSTFVNGMFVEGFVQLLSTTSTEANGQCDLVLPFMGFYGDWTKAPMLDYDAYEIAAFEQDTSYTDETRPQANVWATQAYSQYQNGQYYVPIGSYMYLQDEAADEVYANQEHNVLSCYNIYNGENESSNYCTTTGIYALYAGLLRNAEIVKFNLKDVKTGEFVYSGEDYRIGKAYSTNGGTPGRILTEMFTSELGLANNGKYELSFDFYFYESDVGKEVPEENKFTMTFYVDYEAPVMQSAALRYYDYLDGNTPKQNIYLEIEVYDNTYAQSLMLCYGEETPVAGDEDETELSLIVATDYVTPIYDSVFNGTTTVSIDVTNLITYVDGAPRFPAETMYVRVDDYGLNASVWQVNFGSANVENATDSFTITNGLDLSLNIYETHNVELAFDGEYNLSNFIWSTDNEEVAVVKNGEIVGLSQGVAYITVSSEETTHEIKVTVSNIKLPLNYPTITFGNIINYNDAIVPASGVVEVNAAENFTLEIIPTPWYYPVDELTISWSSRNANIATVTDGVVQTLEPERGGTTVITARIMDGTTPMPYSASVILNVRDPFTISNYTLTDYHGMSEEVTIPTDRNIMYIGEEAFQDNNTVKRIIIPKTVTQIQRRAFQNCTALEEVYFIQKTPLPVPDASLSLILRNAFDGCENLKLIDLTNCKTITADQNAFQNCTALTEVRAMDRLGSLYKEAFKGCTKLETVDLSGLHKSLNNVFEGCTSLKNVTTAAYTAFGESMFKGCTALREITINMPVLPALAFEDCTNLTTVNFGSSSSQTTFFINSQAFKGCTGLTTVNFYNNNVARIGDQAFLECTSLSSIELPAGTLLGSSVFAQETSVTYNGEYTTDSFGSIYSGTTLVLAPKEIPANFEILATTTEIGQYAFSGTSLVNGASTVLNVPASVTKIGEGAFAQSRFTEINFAGALTQIPAHAFDSSSITKFTIGSRVTSIGEYAFAGCLALNEIDFDGTSTLANIGNYAFANAKLSNTLTLPASLTTIGEGAFQESGVTTVNLDARTTLGAYAFYRAMSLVTITFNSANVVATSPTVSISDFAFFYATALKNVTLGTNVTSIGNFSFAGCTALESFNLANVTTVGAYAFAMPVNTSTSVTESHLAVVNNIDKLTDIGVYAFSNTILSGALNLAEVTIIRDYAFAGVNTYTSLSIPKVETIGSFAFADNNLTSISLPESVTSIGSAAFVNSNIATVTINSNNKNYFVTDNVLYRNVYDTNNVLSGYELTFYPSARVATLANAVRSYTIIDETISVQAYAMAYLKTALSTSVKAVELPYSIKTLGESAFYSSGIITYTFNSINAPALLTSVFETGVAGLRAYYYTTFEDEVLFHTTGIIDPVPPHASLTIYYPTNGVGYTNHIFSIYFASRNLSGVKMTDDTRNARSIISGLAAAATVATWTDLSATEPTNIANVTAFSDQVKAAHELYNRIRNDADQLEFLGSDNEAKLFAIEDALVAVKQHFNIQARVSTLALSSESTHKTAYVEGETFDMTGLIIIATYDDYSSREVDLTQCTLENTDELDILTRYVTISGNAGTEYAGKRISIAITVTSEPVDDGGSEEGGDGENAGNTEEPANNSTMIIIICSVVAGVVVLAGAAVALILIMKGKNNERKN